MIDQKADGWVAWRDSKAGDSPYQLAQNQDMARTFSSSEELAEAILFDRFMGEWPDWDSKKDCAAMRSLKADGWRIRPVRLQFLDEPQRCNCACHNCNELTIANEPVEEKSLSNEKQKTGEV